MLGMRPARPPTCVLQEGGDDLVAVALVHQELLPLAGKVDLLRSQKSFEDKLKG